MYLDIKILEEVEAAAWDPQQYLQFAAERGRPFEDLLARVAADRPALRRRPRLRAGQPDRRPWPTAGRRRGRGASTPRREMIERRASAAAQPTAGLRSRSADLREWRAAASRSTCWSPTRPCSGCPATSTCCRGWSSGPRRAGGSPSRCPATSASRSHTADGRGCDVGALGATCSAAATGPGRRSRSRQTYLELLAGLGCTRRRLGDDVPARAGRRRRRAALGHAAPGCGPCSQVLDDDADREEFLADYARLLRAGVPAARPGARSCRSAGSSSWRSGPRRDRRTGRAGRSGRAAPRAARLPARLRGRAARRSTSACSA